MTQTWGSWTEDGQHVTGTIEQMMTVVENNTPLKRGWCGQWRDYLVVRGQAHGMQYVRTDAKGRFVAETPSGSISHPRCPTGPVIRPA